MEKISIVFISDNDYVLQTSTAIMSLIENKQKNTFYDVYILSCNILDNNKQKLLSMKTSTCAISIIDIDISKYGGLHRYKSNSLCVASEAALIKFDIPNIFNDMDKILYLDSDIIVRNDLTEFFNISIENVYAGVIYDTGSLYTKDPFVLTFKNYFNSGVMLLNLKKMREDNIPNKLIITKRERHDLDLMDQNIFNLVFGSNVKIIDIKYNFLVINLERVSKKWNIEELNSLFKSNYKNLNELKQKAVIIHFSSKDKPWQYNNVPFFKLWYKYFKKSPYKNTKLKLKKSRVVSERKRYIKQFIKNIFSLTNENYHKIICILGIKIKLKSKLKMLEKQIAEVDQKFTFLYKNGLNKEKIDYEIKRNCRYGLNNEERNQKIIISLTSYPERIYDLHYTIYSLLNQTIKPDKIVLYLSSEQFPNGKNDIGENVLNMCKFGLTIEWCEHDIKSYKKLIPALKEYPEDLIVTVDDDIYYENNFLEIIYNAYLKSSKNCIIARRCHKIGMDKNGFLPYEKWEKCISKESCSYSNFLTSGGGCLFPPHCLSPQVVDEKKFKKLAPNADDIWFWAMAVLNHTKIQLTKPSVQTLTYVNPVRELNLNNDGTLYVGNRVGGNDRQLQNVINEYPEILNIIKDSAGKSKNDM